MNIIIVLALFAVGVLAREAGATEPVGVIPKGAANHLGCINSQDIENKLTDAVDRLHSSLEDLATKAKPLDGLVSGMATAATNVLKEAIDKAESEIDGATVCLGDFDASTIINADQQNDDLSETGCMNLPLVDSGSWTIASAKFPAKLLIDVDICPEADEDASMFVCVAFSLVKNEPNVAVAINGDMLSCALGNTALEAATDGVNVVLAEGIEAGVAVIAGGFSSNDLFTETANIFTGSKSTDQVSIEGNYFDIVDLDFNVTKLGIREDLVDLKGTMNRVVSIDGEAAAFSDAMEDHKGQGRGDDLLDAISDLSFSAMMNVDMTADILLKEATKGLLQDFEDIPLVEADAYMTTTTSTIISGTTVAPGVYFYAETGGDLIDAVKAVLESLLKSVNGAVVSAGWLTKDILGFDVGNDISKLVDHLEEDVSKLSGGKLQLGFMTSVEQVSLFVNVPLAGSALELAALASFDLNSEKFKFNLSLDGKLDKYLLSELKKVGDDLVWVAQEVDKGVDELQKDGKIIGAGIADATNDVLSLSAEGLQQGADAIKKAGNGVDDDLKAWANDSSNYAMCGLDCTSNEITDALLCGTTYMSDAVYCGTKLVTDSSICGVETVSNGLQCGYKQVQCGTEIITSGAECGYDTVKNCLLKWPPLTNCKKPKSCEKVQWCNTPKSCSIPKSCRIDLSCDVPNTCSIRDCSKVTACKGI